jgi:contractile injection system tape measure protein
MGFPGKHIILKQVIDCEYHGDTDGFDLQRRITEWCNRELIPRIDEQLQTVQTGALVYKIDKLHIEVQVDERGNWLSTTAELIVQQLHKRVEEEIGKAASDITLQAKTYPQLFVEAFIYFLQYGNLPWWSPVTTNQVWQEELESLLITGFSDNAKSRLLQILKHQKVQQRLLYQMPDELFIKLMVQINPGIEKDITNLINDIKQLVQNAEERKAVLTLFRQSVMAFIYEVESYEFAGHVYGHFVQQLSATGHLAHVHINSGKFSAAIVKAMETQKSRTETPLPNAKEPEKDTPIRDEGKEMDLQQGLYINNAGLVIVAPFLPSLFKKLELFDGTAITDINRAVFLVQYLASGRERVAEFETGLAKILCGVAPDFPVDTNIFLTKEEKHELNDLLESAIEYWNILKDTSPEGLRQSFLQRQGKIQFVNNCWLLQVEPKAWDVLLQHLPWNISMLKLPWMEYMLKTEWGY